MVVHGLLLCIIFSSPCFSMRQALSTKRACSCCTVAEAKKYAKVNIVATGDNKSVPDPSTWNLSAGEATGSNQLGMVSPRLPLKLASKQWPPNNCQWLGEPKESVVALTCCRCHLCALLRQRDHSGR